MIKAHIGFDDVDAIEGGCTTHFAAQLAWKLRQTGVLFVDYPNLVRLNPAVPFKTRGNGAVALRIAVESEQKLRDIWLASQQMLDEYTSALKDPKHQPVIALVTGNVDVRLKHLAEKALYDVIPLDLAVKVAEKSHVLYYAPKGGKRGLVGALASTGYTMMDTDYTFELIAYRKPEFHGKPRRVDKDSVLRMNELYGDRMILNYDPSTDRVLITPHGPDPVLFGLRGEDPSVLLEALGVLKVEEPIDIVAIFRTNQHTDSHLRELGSICDVRPYTCVKLKGVVSSKPRRLVGGHVFFELCDSQCCISVAAYEPTKEFRNVVEKLCPNDVVEVCGCIRPPGPNHGITLNLEKIRVIEVARVVVYENPKCPLCGSRMESVGRGKGFRCRKCQFVDPRATKIPVEAPRDLKPGWYQPPYSAFKHHMKPLERFGREKRLFDGIVKHEVVFRPA